MKKNRKFVALSHLISGLWEVQETRRIRSRMMWKDGWKKRDSLIFFLLCNFQRGREKLVDARNGIERNVFFSTEDGFSRIHMLWVVRVMPRVSTPRSPQLEAKTKIIPLCLHLLFSYSSCSFHPFSFSLIFCAKSCCCPKKIHCQSTCCTCPSHRSGALAEV